MVATVTGSCLLIRSCANNAVIQIFESELKSTSQWRFVKWYTQGKNNIGKVRDARVNNKQGGPIWRLLLADDDFVHLYDASGAQSRVKIGNLAGNTGKIADVQFGFTEDQVLVFSDFGFKVTFLTVSKKRGLEFRDPKKNCTCYNYRPGTGHLALLTRPSLHDILLILQPDDSGPVESVELPTIDAQGVLWSPNGQWLVIWDTASAGYKVLIYTADGHLFKTYHGGQDADNIGLGAKTFTWSPSGEFLAIGDFDQRIVLLKCKTVRGPPPSTNACPLLGRSSTLSQLFITKAPFAFLRCPFGKSKSMLPDSVAMFQYLNQAVPQREFQTLMTVLASPLWNSI